MGIFSSEYKTRVGTSVVRVIGDDMLPSSVKSGVLKALIGGEPLVESILEEITSGMGVKAGRMYEYGRDHYTFGLPHGTLVSTADGETTTTGLLKDLYGASLVVDYYRFGPFNNLHYGWQALMQSHGYVPATNQLGVLTAAKGTPVYLKDMVVVVGADNLAQRMAGTLAQWGVAPNAGMTPERPLVDMYGQVLLHSPVQVVPGSGADYVQVSYVWRDGAGVLQADSLTLPIPAHTETTDYYQVRYTLNGAAHYWTYQAGSGTHAELDDLYSPDTGGLGSFFPFTYFRFNKASMAVDTSLDEYKTSKKMMKLLGMDYASVIDSIHESPDIADVESALMMMAVPANPTDPLERRYLYDFFERVYFEAGGLGTQGVGGQGASASSFTAQQTAVFLGDTPNRISFMIQDARFKMAVTMNSIFKRKKAGSLGPVGTHTSELGFVSEAMRVVYGHENTVVEWVEQVPVFYYRKQISDSVYEEIQVYGLQTMYFIWGDYLASSLATEQGGAALLLIPLDYSITEAYSIPDRETLYARSLHYVFNSRTTTEVAWYQSEGFMFLVQVASVAMILSGIPVDLATTIAANSLFVNAVMAAFYAGVYLVKMIAIKLFLKVVGLEAALLVALIAAAMGMYQMMDAGSVAGAPWAKDLLALANGLSSGVNESLAEAMSGLADEAGAFSTWMDDQTKLLEEANKLLDTSHALSPFVIFGESPDDYYNRTVHSGNIGLNGIEAITSYVQISLTLPKLNETLLGDPNGNV